MDSLSVTASIIAVIDVTQKVISLCNDYRAAVKEASWELSRIIEEVGSLQNVLRNLQSLATQAENAQNAADSRLPQLKEFCYPNTGALALYFSDIQTLQQKLVPPSWSGVAGSKRRAIIRAVGLSLKKEFVESTLKNVERHGTTLSLTLGVNTV